MTVEYTFEKTALRSGTSWRGRRAGVLLKAQGDLSYRNRSSKIKNGRSF